MPYYIYRMRPPAPPEYIDALDRYQDARQRVRELRAAQGMAPANLRMMFAKSLGEAERLLSAPRDDRVIGED